MALTMISESPLARMLGAVQADGRVLLVMTLYRANLERRLEQLPPLTVAEVFACEWQRLFSLHRSLPFHSDESRCPFVFTNRLAFLAASKSCFYCRHPASAAVTSHAAFGGSGCARPQTGKPAVRRFRSTQRGRLRHRFAGRAHHVDHRDDGRHP